MSSGVYCATSCNGDYNQLIFLLSRSHLLARLGKAEKIGNLVGQFDFSGERDRSLRLSWMTDEP